MLILLSSIVCDSQIHRPIALLNGRDGVELKKWLEQNNHIKTVTRDTASSYAKAIKAALLDAIQVTDRFRLHQNLLEAVKDSIGRVLPEKVEVTDTSTGTENKTELEDAKNCVQQVKNRENEVLIEYL